jgi:hypothetical protein
MDPDRIKYLHFLVFVRASTAAAKDPLIGVNPKFLLDTVIPTKRNTIGTFLGVDDEVIQAKFLT